MALDDARCRSCRGKDLQPFYRAERIPVHSCLMVGSREEALAFPRGDLELRFCRECGFIQNQLFDPDNLRYSTDYEETQGFSARFRRFQTELCQQQIEKYDLRGKKVLEIGCGKGEFLVELCELGGNHGIGIDPSYRPERTNSPAAERIEFIQDLYSAAYTHLRADYVACRHTLEHIHEVRDFVGMVRSTLKDTPKTVVFFELPGMERVLAEQAFWDIYYEHCTYFTLGSLGRLFRSTGFEILDLYKDYDDQYLMIEARPCERIQTQPHPAEESVEECAAMVATFQEKIERRMRELRGELEKAKAASHRAVAWGSGSKAVSFLTTLGVGTDLLEYVVDINPHKTGKFLAGSGQEIVAPGFLEEYRPDVVFVMNPIYTDEIRADLERMGLSPRIVAI